MEGIQSTYYLALYFLYSKILTYILIRSPFLKCLVFKGFFRIICLYISVLMINFHILSISYHFYRLFKIEIHNSSPLPHT